MASIPIVDGIDVSSLRLFLSVVELGSVSKAARRHSVTQPSATAKLHKLERQLGVQLFDRGPSGSVPTADGTGLAAACADVVAAAVELVDRAETIRAARRRLTIAATRHVADHFLPGWIAGGDLESVTIDLIETTTLAVAQTVRSGEAAIGFTEGPHAPLALRSELVATERVVPVVGRPHQWHGRRRPLEPSALAKTTLILAERGSGTRDVVEAALSAQGHGEQGDHIEVATSAGARLAALSGSGVGFLPRCRVAADLDSGDLRELSIRSVTIEQPVRAVWRGVRPSDRLARRLVDLLRQTR